MVGFEGLGIESLKYVGAPGLFVCMMEERGRHNDNRSI
jgi:hypothetical protein